MSPRPPVIARFRRAEKSFQGPNASTAPRPGLESDEIAGPAGGTGWCRFASPKAPPVRRPANPVELQKSVGRCGYCSDVHYRRHARDVPQRSFYCARRWPASTLGPTRRTAGAGAAAVSQPPAGALTCTAASGCWAGVHTCAAARNAISACGSMREPTSSRLAAASLSPSRAASVNHL